MNIQPTPFSSHDSLRIGLISDTHIPEARDELWPQVFEVFQGVDAIGVLRQQFGAKVPAILVTGSTMTGHEKDAQVHDFHLLIKPVVPNKLRAMIAFKLGVKALG